MGIIHLTLALMSMLYLGGAFLMIFFRKDSNCLNKFAAPFPLGCGLWSIIWISAYFFVRYLMGTPTNHQITIVSLRVYIFLTIALVFISIYEDKLSKRELLQLCICLLIFCIFGYIFYQLKTIWILGDSYFWITWSQEVSASLKHGLPVFNLTFANLSAIISPDYYIFIIHPLAGLCLLLLLFGVIQDNFKANFYEKNNRYFSFLGYCFLPIAILLIFSSNAMFARQMFYSNHHVFAAIFILFFASFLNDSAVQTLACRIYYALVLLMLCIVRMEGFLFALLAIFVYLSGDKEVVSKRKSLLIFMLVQSPYLLFLITSFWSGGFISGKQYLIMFVFGWLFTLIYQLNHYSQRFLLKRENAMHFPLVFYLVLLFLTFLRPEHMLRNFFIFLTNFLSLDFWGVSHFFIVIVIPPLLFFRLKFKITGKSYDYHLIYFVSSTLLILILSFFRISLRIGMTDSANRMVFHFLPLIYLWIALELIRIISFLVKDRYPEKVIDQDEDCLLAQNP